MGAFVGAERGIDVLTSLVENRSILPGYFLIGVDPVNVDPVTKKPLVAVDALSKVITDHIQPLIDAGAGDGLSESDVDRLIVAKVKNFALVTATGLIPLSAVDESDLVAFLRRQASYPRDDETLISSKGHAFDARANTRLALDVGEVLPEAGTIYVTISDPSDSKLVSIDAAALHALNDATESINWRDPDDPADSGSFLHVPNAVSQDEDGNFNLGFLVGKNVADGNNFLLIQLDGNTTLNRQVKAIAVADIPFESRVVYDETTHILSVTTRTGKFSQTETYQLSAAGTVIPNTEPPDVHYHHTIPQSSLRIVADPNSTQIPEGGSFSIKIDGLVYSDHHFTYENLRSKTVVAAGDGGTTDSTKGIRIPGVTGYVYRSAANHPLIWLRDTTAARDVELVDHQIANLETGLTIFDQTYTSGVARNVFQVDDDGEEYNPDTDGIADLYINGTREEVITKTLWTNLAEVTDNQVRTNQGQEYTGKGYLAKVGNKPAWCIPTDSLAFGTIAFPQHLEIRKRPVSYVRVDSFKALWGAEISRHPAVTYDAESDTWTALWRTEDIATHAVTSGKIADGSVGSAKLDTPTRAKVDKTDDIEDSALTTSTAQVPVDKVPLPTITDVARLADIPSAVGGTKLYKFTASDGAYRANDIVLRTSTGLTVLFKNFAEGFVESDTFPSSPSNNQGLFLTADQTHNYVDAEGRTKNDAQAGDIYRYSTESSTWNLQYRAPRTDPEFVADNLDVIPREKLPPPVIRDDSDQDDFDATPYNIGDLVNHSGELHEIEGVLASRERDEATINSYDEEMENHVARFYQDGDDAKMEFRVDLEGIGTWDGTASQGQSIQVGGAFGDSPRKVFTRDNLKRKMRFGYNYLSYTSAGFRLPGVFPKTLDFLDHSGASIAIRSGTVDSNLSGSRLVKADELAPVSPYPSAIEVSPFDEVDFQVLVRTNPQVQPFKATFPAYQPITRTNPLTGLQTTSHYSIARNYTDSNGVTHPLPAGISEIVFYGNSDGERGRVDHMRAYQTQGRLDNFHATVMNVKKFDLPAHDANYDITRNRHGYYQTDSAIDTELKIPAGGATREFYFVNASAHRFPETPESQQVGSFNSMHLKPQLLVTLNESNFFGRFRNGSDNTWDTMSIDGNPSRFKLNSYPNFGAIIQRWRIPGHFDSVWTRPILCRQLHDLASIARDSNTNRVSFDTIGSPKPCGEFLASENFNLNLGRYNSWQLTFKNWQFGWWGNISGEDYWSLASDHIANFVSGTSCQIYWDPMGVPFIRA